MKYKKNENNKIDKQYNQPNFGRDSSLNRGVVILTKTINMKKIKLFK
jgi:hypothetical protein